MVEVVGAVCSLSVCREISAMEFQSVLMAVMSLTVQVQWYKSRFYSSIWEGVGVGGGASERWEKVGEERRVPALTGEGC